MSAPQGRSRRKLADEEDEVVSMVGQRVWFVDQIEPVGTIRETIPQGGGRVVGFIIEDDKTGIVRKVQRSRVRKYGERYFLVTSWFARADQAAKELEKQLSKGMAPDRDLRYWQQFTERLGQDTLRTHLTRVAPPTYGVAGQLATAAESLSQDLARASVGFRRVQRALVANQAVMSPEEYAQFVDEARKWSRTVRLVLMSVEFMARSLPRAQIDVRNPDAPLPALPVYIPFESLLEAHTPSGEGKARERPAGPTVEAVDEGEFAEVFAEEAGGEWQEAEDFEATTLLALHRPGRDQLTLTTLHQAKGLEFDVVFIADAAEGSFPDLRRTSALLRRPRVVPERIDGHALRAEVSEMEDAPIAMLDARVSAGAGGERHSPRARGPRRRKLRQ